MRTLALILTLALGACAAKAPPPIVKTRLIGSDMCKIQRAELSWDIHDTPETVDGVRKFNQKWRSRCSRRGRRSRGAKVS